MHRLILVRSVDGLHLPASTGRVDVNEQKNHLQLNSVRFKSSVFFGNGERNWKNGTDLVQSGSRLGSSSSLLEQEQALENLSFQRPP